MPFGGPAANEAFARTWRNTRCAAADKAACWMFCPFATRLTKDNALVA
jgi:hypothetical protein